MLRLGFLSREDFCVPGDMTVAVGVCFIQQVKWERAKKEKEEEMYQIEARHAAKPLSFSSWFFFFLQGHIYLRTKVKLNTTQNVFSRSRSSLPVSLLSFMSQTLKYCLLIFFLNSIQKFCVASLLAYMLFLWLYRQCFCVAFFGSVANVTQHCSLPFL